MHRMSKFAPDELVRPRPSDVAPTSHRFFTSNSDPGSDLQRRVSWLGIGSFGARASPRGNASYAL